MSQTTEDLTYPGGLTRLFVEQSFSKGQTLVLGDDQSHYLINVLRAKIGQSVRVFNGKDGEWSASIESASRKSIVLILDGQTRNQVGVPDLWLLLAPIKKTPLDYIVQKATELGVSRIIPVFTRRTIVERVNTDRMLANAIEAAEQSERLTVPEIAEPLKLEKLLAHWDDKRRIVFCDENRTEACPASALQRRDASSWAILTGPEGGFDNDERSLIRALPFVVRISLGPRILRADTAALAALAVWQSTCGDWD